MTARIAPKLDSIRRSLDIAVHLGQIRGWHQPPATGAKYDRPMFVVHHHGRCPVEGEYLTVREAEVFCTALASARYAEPPAVRQ